MDTAAWNTVLNHAARLADVPLSRLGAGALAPVELEGMYWDFSRQHVDAPAWAALKGLAHAADLSGWRQRLFAGAVVNQSENRPAVHPALRGSGSAADAGITAMQGQIKALAGAMARRELRGAGGQPLTQVVHVGIGGSRWGPALLTQALADDADPGVELHYVASLDPHALRTLLTRLDAARVMVIVASKSFTTAETTRHREALRDWLSAQAGPQAPAAQMWAVTAQADKARAAGIAADRIVEFPAAVGGRYSVWSAVGLPAALTLGPEAWQALLDGAAAADEHFLRAPDDANLPLRLGLLDVWYASAWRLCTRAVLPYEQRLGLLPAYLQQLYMESCGKGVDREGQALSVPGAPVFFGGDGNEAEHTFMQALHQGTQVVPAEFLVCRGPDDGLPGHRRRLIAQCLGQAQALAFGSPPDVPAHARCPGNRPSIVTLLPALTARVLGALLATYEHRVFTAAAVWGINPFDQWGVELGKQLAGPIEAALAGDGVPGSLSPALAGLVGRVRAR